MKLFIFEWKKIFFSKRFLLLLLLLMIGILLLFVRNITFQAEIEREEMMQVNRMLNTAYGFSAMHNAVLEDDRENEDEQELLVLNSSNVDTLYELRTLVTSDNKEMKLQAENELYLGIEEYMEAGGDPLLPPDEMSHQLALNEKLMEAGIEPQHDRYSLAMANFMKQITDLLLSLGAIVLFVLVLGDKLSGEYENRTIHLLFTQPMDKRKVVTSKFTSAVAIYFLVLAFIYAMTAVVGWLLGEPGTFSYPITAEQNGAIVYMTIGEYILLALAVIIPTILFILALVLFYSQLFKATLPTLFALILTIGAGFLLTILIPWSGLNWLNPFQYIFGMDALLYQNERVWYQGIPVLLILTLVFYLFSLQKIKTSKLN